MYSSVAALALNTFINQLLSSRVFNYCELPHLLQNLSSAGIVDPQTMQFLTFVAFEGLLSGFILVVSASTPARVPTSTTRSVLEGMEAGLFLERFVWIDDLTSNNT